MFDTLAKRAGGKVAAARLLGIPYTSSYSGFSSAKRKVPTYLLTAIEALLRLPDGDFKEMLDARNFTPTEERPWVILMLGPKGPMSPSGVATSGARYRTKHEAVIAAKKLKAAGFFQPTAAYRPNPLRLADETALD